MLAITPAQFQQFEGQAWDNTRAWLPNALRASVADDGQLTAALNELSSAATGRLADESVALAQQAQFDDREDVLALARLLLRYGPSLERSPLMDDYFSPSERIAIMERLAKNMIQPPVPSR